MARMTHDQVERIVGHGRLNDHTIAEIIRSGAGPGELLEAFNRTVRGGSDLGAEVMHPSTPRVSRLCGILAEGLESMEDWDDR